VREWEANAQVPEQIRQSELLRVYVSQLNESAREEASYRWVTSYRLKR
jgi:hypothetical protein